MRLGPNPRLHDAHLHTTVTGQRRLITGAKWVTALTEHSVMNGTWLGPHVD